MVKANSFGLTRAHIMEISFKIIFMAKASTNGLTVESTTASGSITRWRAKEHSHGATAVDMREITRTIRSMVMEPLSGQTAESI